MYLFLDTEFTDFKDCDLISLGLISEDGQYSFYVEITDHTVSWRSQFVREVVVPMLDYAKYGKSHHEACVALREWLESLPAGEIVIVVDFMMDTYLMQEMLKTIPQQRPVIFRMIEKAFMSALHERGFHMVQQLDVAFREMVQGTEEYYEEVDSRRHHALVDAKANRHGWLKGFEHAKRT